ncbi:hypothetical protein [Dactylosporangium sp. NPDC000521]
MLELAGDAQRTEAGDAAWQAELAYWTGGTRPTGSGIRCRRCLGA